MPPLQSLMPPSQTDLSQQPRAGYQSTQSSPYRTPVTRVKTKKAMLIVMLFMIIGTLLVTIIGYVVRGADSRISPPKPMLQNQVLQPIDRNAE